MTPIKVPYDVSYPFFKVLDGASVKVRTRGVTLEGKVWLTHLGEVVVGQPGDWGEVYDRGRSVSYPSVDVTVLRFDPTLVVKRLLTYLNPPGPNEPFGTEASTVTRVIDLLQSGGMDLPDLETLKRSLQ